MIRVTSKKGTSVYLNPRHIVAVFERSSGSKIFTTMGTDTSGWDVAEPFEEVLTAIENDRYAEGGEILGMLQEIARSLGWLENIATRCSR